MLKIKFRLKFLLINVLSVITLLLILGTAFICDKLVETIISIILFYIFRELFIKQYHSSTAIKCAILSLIVFYLVIRLELRLSESILFNLILIFVINTLSYCYKDYKDKKIELTINENRIKKMYSKRLEELSENELLVLLPGIKSDTIHIVYGYIHRKKGITANEYAYKYNISEALMYKYLKLVKDEFRNLSN